ACDLLKGVVAGEEHEGAAVGLLEPKGHGPRGGFVVFRAERWIRHTGFHDQTRLTLEIEGRADLQGLSRGRAEAREDVFEWGGRRCIGGFVRRGLLSCEGRTCENHTLHSIEEQRLYRRAGIERRAAEGNAAGAGGIEFDPVDVIFLALREQGRGGPGQGGRAI